MKRLLRNTLIGICGLCALPLTALYILKTRMSARALATSAISSKEGFEELIQLSVNGSSQWILARTKNSSAPLLLMVDGGPGSSTMPFARGNDESLLNNFVVIHWDQRATGKSFHLSHPLEDAGTAESLADMDVVVRYLLRKYNRPKIFILAASWGTSFAAQYSSRHPDLVAAYIAVGQVYDEIATERVRYDYLRQAAERREDIDSIKDLENVKFPHSVSDLLIINRQLFQCKCGLFYNPPPGGAYGILAYDFMGLFSSPEYDFSDLLLYEPAQYLLAYRYMHQVLTFKMPDEALSFQIPVFFISGEFDYMTPVPLAKQYFEAIDSPQKEFFEVKGAAHIVSADAPFEYAKIVKSIPARIRR